MSLPADRAGSAGHPAANPAAALPLVDRLFRDADAEVTRRIASANAERVARLDAARSAASDVEAAAVAAHQRTLQMQARLETEDRSRAASRLVADARQRAVSRVLDTMSVRLGECAHGSDRVALMRGLLREAMPYLSDRKLRARTSHESSELVRAILPHADVVEDDAIVFGAVLSDHEGRLRVDATLHGRLARAGAPLAIRIATSLDALSAAASKEPEA